MASNWWSSSRTFAPGAETLPVYQSLPAGGLGRDEKAALKQGRGGQSGLSGLQGLRAGHLLESAETAISQKIANEQGAELHRSAPCLCVTPVRRPLCGR